MQRASVLEAHAASARAGILGGSSSDAPQGQGAPRSGRMRAVCVTLIRARRGGTLNRVCREEQLLYLRSRERPAEQVSLKLIALLFPQEGQLPLGLHSLGDDPPVQFAAQGDDRLRDDLVVRIRFNVTDE